MHATIARAAALALVLAAVLAAGAARAQELQLTNLVVDSQAGAFTARFGVKPEGLIELKENLDAGITLALTAEAELAQAGGLLGGDTVFETAYVSELTYDALTKNYVIKRPGAEPVTGEDLAQVMGRGWGRVSMALGPWEKLTRGSDYVLTLTVALKRQDLPNWFERTLFFWSWEAVPATTYQLEFTY